MSWRRCRAMRPGEIDGTDYMFVTKAEFESWIKEDKLLEHALVYGEYKGILRSQITHALAHDQDVILRLDVQGAATMRRLMPDSVSIFLVRFLYAWSCLRAQTSFCLQVLATSWTKHRILQLLIVLMLDLVLDIVVQHCYALPGVDCSAKCVQLVSHAKHIIIFLICFMMTLSDSCKSYCWCLPPDSMLHVVHSTIGQCQLSTTSSTSYQSICQCWSDSEPPSSATIL